MKKLTKLNINPEKVMKNEELVTLKGGDYGTYCCFCVDGTTIISAGGSEDAQHCASDCQTVWGVGSMWVCG